MFIGVENSWFIATFGLTCLYLGYGGLVMLAVTAKTPPVSKMPKIKSVMYKCFIFFSMYSYTIYLGHYQIWSVFFGYFHKWEGVSWHPPIFPAFLVSFIGVVFAGVLFSLIVERPALGLRARLINRGKFTGVQS